MHSPNRIVSKRFRDRTLELYPALVKRERLFRFFEFLVFSTFTDRDQRRPKKVVSRKALLDLLGLPATTGSKRFRAADLLDECKDCIPLLKLEWSAYDPDSGQARVITDSGLSQEFLAELRRELTTFHNVPDADKVRYITGERVRPIDATALRSNDEQAATAGVPQVQAATRISNYLNSLPRNVFTTKIQENIVDTVAVAQSLPGLAQSTLELTKLHRIVTQPQPFYGPSEGANTVRLFAKNTSILSLKNPVKYALIRGWTTFDLKSAQLAIVAKDWNIGLLHGWLSNPSNDIWKELCSVFPDIPVTDSKPVIKTAVYSACYGARLETIQADVQAALGTSRVAANALLAHELFIHVLGHRDHQLREIRKHWGANDAFGRFLSANTPTQARSVLAQLSQAREMQLLLPALDLAEQRPNDLRIVLWEHDGFSVHFRRDDARNDRTKRALMRAVNDNCERLGYPTELVEKS
jgi:hypothetical protein